MVRMGRIVLVDAAALAMFPAVLDVVQRFVGDVEQTTQIIALERVLSARNDFWHILQRNHQPGNSLELLLVGRRFTQVGVVAVHGLSLSDSLVTHVHS